MRLVKVCKLLFVIALFASLVPIQVAHVEAAEPEHSFDMLNCLCACLQVGDFSCGYDTTPRPDLSPLCGDVDNGPCMCTAYGCFRGQLPFDGECYDECYQYFGNPEEPETSRELIVPSGNVQLNGQTVDSTVRHTVQTGDTITTVSTGDSRDHGWAVVQYGDGAWIKLKPGTTIQIIANGIRVRVGYTWIKLDKYDKVFTALTPNAHTGRRGTEFEIQASDAGTTVHVFEGEVDVSDIDRLQTVTVAVGQRSTVPDNGFPSAPEMFNTSTADRWWTSVPETPQTPLLPTSTDADGSDDAACFITSGGGKSRTSR